MAGNLIFLFRESHSPPRSDLDSPCAAASTNIHPPRRRGMEIEGPYESPGAAAPSCSVVP